MGCSRMSSRRFAAEATSPRMRRSRSSAPTQNRSTAGRSNSMAAVENLTQLLLDGGRNLVRYVEIHAGQNVLIHTEPCYDDPAVVGAVKAAVEEVGANVSVLHTPH